MSSHPAFIDELRRAHGLMTIAEIGALVARGNAVFDPFSTLIAAGARIGTGNVIHPGASLLCRDGGTLTIGDGNLFHGSTLIEAATGPITIGSANQLGEGGFTAKTNRPGARIVIGDHGRYQGGAAVFGESLLGSGSQILGAVTVDSCTLEAGGSWRDPDPDRRAGLLKGTGTARGLTVPTGRVIMGNGIFAAEEMKPQSFFHPKAGGGKT